MKKFTIQPADAADDMRRNYDRELRRHRKQHRERTRRIVIGALIGTLVLGGITYAAGRKHEQQLPKTQFELAAAAKAAKAKAAKAKAPAKSGGKSAVASTKHASKAAASAGKKSPAGTAKTAAKPATKSGTAATKPADGAMSIASAGKRTFKLAVSDSGFSPARLEVPAGAQIELSVAGAPNAELAGFVIQQLDIEADNTTGVVTIRLGSPGKGSYTFTSYHGTISGTLVVK